jgi:hypothetical protein
MQKIDRVKARAYDFLGPFLRSRLMKNCNWRARYQHVIKTGQKVSLPAQAHTERTLLIDPSFCKKGTVCAVDIRRRHAKVDRWLEEMWHMIEVSISGCDTTTPHVLLCHRHFFCRCCLSITKLKVCCGANVEIPAASAIFQTVFPLFSSDVYLYSKIDSLWYSFTIRGKGACICILKLIARGTLSL